MGLFRKLAFCTDAHFGRSNNNAAGLRDTEEFFSWFIGEAKRRGCDTFIFGGDFFDVRHAIGVQTLNVAMDTLQKIDESFDQSFFILGNHDLFFRESRDLSSVVVARNFPKIKVINSPVTIDDVRFLPWLVGSEKRRQSAAGRYVFSHLEIAGFMMNAAVAMPDSPHAAKSDWFSEHELVFSGHFHKRQQQGNIIYTGSIFPFDFGDAWDEERGAMFMDWGGMPEFVAWPGQPTYRTMKLSDLLNDPGRFLKPKLTARVHLDIEISYEEAQIIKDAFVETHGLRKMQLMPMVSSAPDQTFTNEVIFQSVDQTVIDGLLQVQTAGLDQGRLIEIYKSLGGR